MTGRQTLKRIIDTVCVMIIAPALLMCALEQRVEGAEAVFGFWAQTFALVPGVPGVFVRRAFYRSTLESCGRSFYIGFGALVSHRHAQIGEQVYIGPYAVIGSCDLGRGSLIGTRCSIVSGGDLHVHGADGRLTATNPAKLKRIHIGEDVWLGEGTIVLADIGRSSIVAAGAVVASAVPAGTVVAGNPARFVRRMTA